MICCYRQPDLPLTRTEFVPSGEYIVRLIRRGVDQRDDWPNRLLMAEILEGRHDGRRIAFKLAPSVAHGFISNRQVESLAARGACCMVKVAVRTDCEGHRMNVITSLNFLGYEPSGLNDYDLN